MARHERDADCTLDDRDTCTACGVHHGEPCGVCGERGYHAPECDLAAPPEPDGADRIGPVTRSPLGKILFEMLRPAAAACRDCRGRGGYPVREGPDGDVEWQPCENPECPFVGAPARRAS